MCRASTQLVVIIHPLHKPLRVTLLEGTIPNRQHANPVEGENDQPRFVVTFLARCRLYAAQRPASAVDERLGGPLSEVVPLHRAP